MKLRSIQVMRALAATLVLLHHVFDFPLGAAGVDLFFVISGFIIASVAPGKDPVEFLVKRGVRIYPLYWLCQAPFLFRAWQDSKLSAKTVWTSLSLISVGGVSRPALGVGWTLIFEVFFYLMAAASLAIKDYRPVLGLLLISLTLNNIVSSNYVLGFLGHPIMLEFLCGVLIYRLPRSREAAVAGLLSATLILLFVGELELPWAWVYDQSAHEYQRLIYWGIPATLIIYGALAFERFFERSWLNPIVLLGDASYSLYLTFPSVLAFTLWPPLIIPIAILLGVTTHLGIEKALVRNVMKGFIARKAKRTEATAVHEEK